MEGAFAMKLFLVSLAISTMLAATPLKACECMCITTNHNVVAKFDAKDRADCIGYCQYASAARHQLVDPVGNCMNGAGDTPVDDAKPVHVIDFHGGCIAWFWHGTYFSENCKNLRGCSPEQADCKTHKAWPGNYEEVQAFVVFEDCVFTAFVGGQIFRSCDGLNLGTAPAGSHSKLLYNTTTKVKKMTVRDGKLCTVFEHDECYLDPTGDSPASGTHCKPETCEAVE